MDENTINKIGIDITPIVVKNEESAQTNVHVGEPLVQLDGEPEEIVDIEVIEPAPVLNEMEMLESVYAAGNLDGTNHAILYGRDLNDQHPISAITNLENRLHNIEMVQRVYSSESGVSEFREWYDKNPDGENRTGYFVTIVDGDKIKKCDVTHDVYGVTVSTSGFVGNQDALDKSDNYMYAMVGIVGAMRVRTDGTARVGEYVIPNQYGEATFSDEGYGYKVLSEGSNSSYEYVVIAVTPQSDALSRFGGSGSGSGTGSGDFSDIIIEINGIKDAVDNMQIEIDGTMSKDEIKDIINENLSDIQNQATSATTIANEALTNAQLAQAQASVAASSAAQAQQQAESAANEAFKQAQQAATDVSNLTSDMQEVLGFELKDSNNNVIASGVSGLVQVTKDNKSYLGEMMTLVNEHETEIGALLLKSTDGGVEIQSLINHIDKYSVGAYSTSYGLSKQNARELLTSEYIYVPTSEHEETLSDISINPETGEEIDNSITISFEYGYAYKWDPQHSTWNKDVDEQGQPKKVSTATTYKDGESEGDLWYCWGDPIEIRDDNNELIAIYHTGTLYRWSGFKWIGVATVADNNQSRMLTSVTQTAHDITQSVLNGKGEGSVFKQEFDSILSTVKNNDGYISALEQTAESIRAGTYSGSDTASQLEMLVSDTDAALNQVASGRFHVVYQSYVGSAPDSYDGNKYSKKPTWNDSVSEFVFDESYVDDVDGEYYFYIADKTKYCKVTDGGYEIYTIGNKATSGLQNRITNTEAILTGTAMLDTDESSSLANVTVKADENGSSVTSVASYYYHSLVDIEEKEPTFYGTYKYIKPPVWNIGLKKYVFDINDRHSDGIIFSNLYWLIDEAAQTYCKTVITVEEEPKTLYEIYGLGGNSNAAIVQEVTANKSTIGMIAENGEVKGSLIIEAINGDESNAKLQADKVNISGFVTVTSLSTAGQTTINGGNITTGVIKSSEYSYTSGNTYSNKGTSFDLSNGVIRSKNFAIDANGNAYFKGNITATGGTIGGFTIGSNALYNNKSSLSSITSGVYVGTDGISVGSQTAKQYTYNYDGVVTDYTYITIPGFKVSSDGVVTLANINFANTATIGSTEFSLGSEGEGSLHAVSIPHLQANRMCIGDQATGENYTLMAQLSNSFILTSSGTESWFILNRTDSDQGKGVRILQHGTQLRFNFFEGNAFRSLRYYNDYKWSTDDTIPWSTVRFVCEDFMVTKHRDVKYEQEGYTGHVVISGDDVRISFNNSGMTIYTWGPDEYAEYGYQKLGQIQYDTTYN